jgi:Fe-S-cluster containining protein
MPEPRVWYEQGVRFTCQPGCALCCSGEPGYVHVSDQEKTDMAATLDLSRDDFERRYVRQTVDGDSLKELRNGDCALLENTRPGCTVYEARPTQCRTFPFWPEFMVSPRAYNELKSECPGIGVGKLCTREEIESMMAESRESGVWFV